MLLYFLLTFMFFCMNPLILSITLIFFTVFLSMTMMKITNLMFFSYLFIMVYTSGIMVLFCYLSSFVPNKLMNKFNFMFYLLLILAIWFSKENFSFEMNTFKSNLFISNNFYTYMFFILFILCVYLFNLVFFLSLKKYPLRMI